jgi:hypothetical protein
LPKIRTGSFPEVQPTITPPNEKYKDIKMEAASDVAELLIVLRFQELISASVQTAGKKGLQWATIPVFASAHDHYDIVFKAG